MRLQLDGPNFSRAHEMTGEEANFTQTFFYDSIPEGRYEIVVTWDTNQNKVVVVRTEACFIGLEERCGELL